jgi:hypothetical protein
MSGIVITAIAVIVYISVVIAYGLRRVHETESRESTDAPGQTV